MIEVTWILYSEFSAGGRSSKDWPGFVLWMMYICWVRGLEFCFLVGPGRSSSVLSVFASSLFFGVSSGDFSSFSVSSFGEESISGSIAAGTLKVPIKKSS